MSRSVHTRPKRILAAARIRAPFAPRAAADQRRPWRLTRGLKERGLVAVEPEYTERKGSPRAPRIAVIRAGPGYIHPAPPRDIARVLRFFGETSVYGVRSIELVRTAGEPAPGGLHLGRLLVPGRVQIVEQPRPPWLLAGRLWSDDAQRLARAGAVLEHAGHGAQTLVHWPGNTLRDFMLLDVLMHEIGHHIVQQYTGKRPTRVRRTRDHEAFAYRFAARCRALYEAGRPLG